jgi:hypothetical protein
VGPLAAGEAGDGEVCGQVARGHGPHGEAPVGGLVTPYKLRNVVEQSFSLLKQWRGLATRCDKLAVVYRAAAVLAAIMTWLRS